MLRINVLGVVFCGALYSVTALPALAIPAQIMCIRAISEGRMSGMNIQQCQCLADVARGELSPPLYLLWTEALYTGGDRMREIRDLGQSIASMTEEINETVEIANEVCGLQLE